MQRLEVSCAVRHIYVVRHQRVKMDLKQDGRVLEWIELVLDRDT